MLAQLEGLRASAGSGGWAIACAPLGWPEVGQASHCQGNWPRVFLHRLTSPAAVRKATALAVDEVVGQLPEAWQWVLSASPSASWHLVLQACAFPGGVCLGHDAQGHVWMKPQAGGFEPYPLPIRLTRVYRATWPGGRAVWAEAGAEVPMPARLAKVLEAIAQDLGEHPARVLPSPTPAPHFERLWVEVRATQQSRGRRLWLPPKDGGPAVVVRPWGAPEDAR